MSQPPGPGRGGLGPDEPDHQGWPPAPNTGPPFSPGSTPHPPPPPPPPGQSPPPPGAPAPHPPAGGSHPGDPNAAYGVSGPWNEQQAYGAPGGQGHWGQGYVQPKADPMAGWGLGLAIFGVFCGFTAPVGLGLGIASLSRQSRQPMVYAGRGLAIAAIVVGSLATMLLALQLLVSIAGPGGGLYGF